MATRTRRKLRNLPLPKDTEKSVSNTKHKGRPKKLDVPVIVKKRGRPKKQQLINKSATSQKTIKTIVKAKPNYLNYRGKLQKMKYKKRINARKTADRQFLAPRLRKPNPKFDDFITSANKKSKHQDSTKKEEKEASIALTNKDICNDNLAEDPLALTNNDEVVKSFLPNIDVSPNLEDVVVVKDQNLSSLETTDVNTEENNKKPKPDITLQQINEVKDSSTDKIQKSVEKDCSNNTNTLKSNILENANSDFTENLSNISENNLKLKDISYVLVDNEVIPEISKGYLVDVDFNKLVRSLKSIKLPAGNWKIRIVVSRQQTITEVTFTNKEAFERCVKFSRYNTGYIVTFGKSVVNLLGVPPNISSFNDVTVLLDIIHNLKTDDPVLEYVEEKVV